MSREKPTYQELEARLAEAEAIIAVLRNQEVDAIVGEEHVALVRLKEVEEALAYYAHLLENVSDAVVATNADFVITAWNRGAEATYGWKKEEVLGRPYSEILRTEFPGANRESVIQAIQKNGYFQGVK